jgi:hypothetical protein
MKRYAFPAAVLCVIVFALVTHGQTEPPQPATPAPPTGQTPVMPTQLLSPPPAPPTTLEARSLQQGVLLVKGYTDVAALDGDNSSVRTTAVQISGGETVYGIIFTIRQNSRDGLREAIGYLDEDEIDPLAGALEAVARLERGASIMDDFEGHYRTRGNLEITNYDRNGARMISIRAVQVLLPSGEITWATARFSVARLTELRQQIAAAKATIARAKAGPDGKDAGK